MITVSPVAALRISAMCWLTGNVVLHQMSVLCQLADMPSPVYHDQCLHGPVQWLKVTSGLLLPARQIALLYAGSVLSSSGSYSWPESIWILGVQRLQQPEKHLQAESCAPRCAGSEDAEDSERQEIACLGVVGDCPAHKLLWGLAHGVRPLTILPVCQYSVKVGITVMLVV